MTGEPLTASTSIRQFLDAAAAKQPAPGGGAVAALAGATAAAIGQMVLSYSVGRKELAVHLPQLESAVTELVRARQVFLTLMVEDQGAFAALQAAKKVGDAREVADMLQACIGIPRAVGATAVAMLGLCDTLLLIVNKYLLSDLAVCAELSMATLRCAVHNVRVNLADLSSDKERATIETALADELSRGVTLVKRIIPAIQSRLIHG